MDEMDLLERVRADVEIDPAALRRARRRMLRQAVAPAVRRRRAARRVVSVVAVAAAVAALAVLVLPGPQGAEPAAAAVLSRAARVAAAEDVAAPGQWLHVRVATTRPGDDIEVRHYVQERWVPGGSSGLMIFRDGEDRWTEPVDRPAIYTDADASVEDLYSWLSRDNGDLRGDEAAFERAGEVMFDSSAPAAFKSHLLEAMALIEGVHVVTEQARFHGHDAVVIGRTDEFSETRFVFDSGTGALLGVESVSETDSLSYSTLFTTNVVDRLPRRAVP
jgi:hypothetical protein